MPSKGDELRKRGFDVSSYDRSSGTWTVRCSECAACIINGVACHETGCRNGAKVKTRQNKGRANRLRQERK